ncbi:MAG TPA: fumarylacetoacetate hydrolase family protein [Acidimicrobiales bacterium]
MDVDAIAERLVRVLDTGATCERVSDDVPGFSADDAYAVLAAIRRRRADSGWRRAGRKIGLTNRTVWEALGVDRPFWADVWDRTVVSQTGDARSVALGSFAQPRIEPEVVFGLRGPVPVTDDPVEVLAAVEWMAPGFEVVRCPYPGWRFGMADCVAAAGFHGALVVGARVPVDEANREAVAAALPSFALTLVRNGELVDSGVGANVLDSPALALGDLARVLSEQPRAPDLAAGELVTTGTITNAHPVRTGEHWRADYGALGLEPFTLTFT